MGMEEAFESRIRHFFPPPRVQYRQFEHHDSRTGASPRAPGALVYPTFRKARGLAPVRLVTALNK